MRAFPTGLGFGAAVLVEAIAQVIVGAPDAFVENVRSRGYLGHKMSDFYPHAQGWPGTSIPVEWVAAPRDYPLEPAPAAGEGDDRPSRVRRFPLSGAPGIVIGATERSEHTISARRSTAPPRRIIPLFEVALTIKNGPARVVLAHQQDLVPVRKAKR